MTHISDRIAAELTTRGWTTRAPLPVEETGARVEFRKILPTGGTFGQAIATLRICQAGRWLERVNGWGAVEKDIDLRDYADDPAGAVAAVLS